MVPCFAGGDEEEGSQLELRDTGRARVRNNEYDEFEQGNVAGYKDRE